MVITPALAARITSMVCRRPVMDGFLRHRWRAFEIIWLTRALVISKLGRGVYLASPRNVAGLIRHVKTEKGVQDSRFSGSAHAGCLELLGDEIDARNLRFLCLRVRLNL